MCPYIKDIVPESIRKLSLKTEGGECLLNVEQEFEITREDLCQLMESRGMGVRNIVEERYGSLQGLAAKLHTSASEGLMEDERCLRKRRDLFGSNVMPMRKPKSFWELMLDALKEPTLIILEVAAAVSLALALWSIFRPGAEVGAGSHEWIEGVAIAIGVLIIVLVSASNDYGKEQQFRALQNRVKEEHKIAVLRNGKIEHIFTQQLVVGDICVVKYGDVTPADGVVLQSQELQVDESSLTGESDAVRKDPDADCQLLAGTHVMEGTGRLMILAVGPYSQTGKIYQLLGAVDKKSTSSSSKISLMDLEASNGKTLNDEKRKEANHSVFQAKLNRLAYLIGIWGFILSSLTSLIIIIRFCIDNYGVQGNPWRMEDLETILDSIIVGITILVSVIPEGLPLAVTLTLAFSARQMMRDNNLVRHLHSCETMGCATTICSDKTGTLTTNRMTVCEGWLGVEIHHPLPEIVPPQVADLLCTAIAVNSSYSSEIVAAKNSTLPTQQGNRTECALLALTAGFPSFEYKKIRARNPESAHVKVYTFNSLRKSMSTVIRIDEGWRVFTKGAAEIVLSRCSSILKETGDLEPLSQAEISRINSEVISKMASNGLRAICVAYKDIPNSSLEPDWNDEAAVTNSLACLGIFGIEDPVRPEVPRAIKQCQEAGICVRMITGDNVETARSIARKCGIIAADDDSLVLDGKEFNKRIRNDNGKIDQKLMDDVWPKLRVLARSTPQDKYTLVEGILNSKISKHREVVAVTGDGTNDGPALKKADVGFAMGIAGTDVAKEASDIILTDDNFISIVKACMWGRNIYDNVSKFLQFQLTVNAVALTVAITSACVLGDSPLKAVPMLWVNMIEDTLGSLALATEPPRESLLKRKPYGRKQQIISRVMTRSIIGQTVYQSAVLLFLLFYGPTLFDIHEKHQVGHVTGEPSLIYTLVFNTLVVMTNFNLINARCISGERNVFAGVLRNRYFVGLWLLMLLVQVLVVQFGGYAFATRPLPWEMWAYSFLFGIGSLLWYHVLLWIPVKRPKQDQAYLKVKVLSE